MIAASLLSVGTAGYDDDERLLAAAESAAPNANEAAFVMSTEAPSCLGSEEAKNATWEPAERVMYDAVAVAASEVASGTDSE